MDEQSKLQIILEAVNETGSPFQDLNTAIESFQKSAADLARSIGESFQSMSSAASETATGIQESLTGDQDSFKSLAQSVSEQASNIEESVSGVDKSVTDMAKSASDATAGVEKSMQNAVSALDEMTQSASKDAGEIGTSFSEVGQASGEASKSISESTNEIARSMQEASASVTDFEKTASSELRTASEAMNTMRNNMGHGVEQIGGLIAIQQLGDAMENLGKQGEHLFDFAIEQGADFQQTMKNIQTVIAVNVAGNETWNQKLQDASGLTDQLQQKALDLGSRGAQSANEVGEAMDTMLRAGVDANTVLNGAAQSAQNVAIVTGEKIDESANLVTEIFHMFRDQFQSNGKSMQENMKETGDVLTGTLLSARINSQDFLDTLKYVGPVASQLGSSLEDTATATAVLAQNGIKGSQAGNNLKRALTSLLEPTKAGAEAMQQLGLIQNGQNMIIDQTTGKMKNLTQIQDILHTSLNGLTEAKKAQYIHDIFGQYAMAGSLVLANENSEAFSTLKEKIAGVSAEQAASSMLDTFSGHMAQLQAHVATTAKEFGMAFMPVLEKLLPIGNAILNWLQNMSEGHKTLVMGVLAAGSAIAIIGGALMTMAISAKFAKEGFEAIGALNPFKKVASSAAEAAAATEALAAAEGEVAATSEISAVGGFAGVFSKMGESIKGVGKIAGDFILGPWKALGSGIKALPGLISGLDFGKMFAGFFEGFGKVMVTLTKPLMLANMGIFKGLEAFVQWVPGAMSTFVSFITNPMKLVILAFTGFQTLMESVAVGFRAALTFMTGPWGILISLIVAGVGAIIANWDTIRNWVQQHFGGTIPTTWGQLRQDAMTIFHDIENVISSVWQSIKTVSEQVWSYIGPYITGAIQKVSTYWNQIWPELEQIFVAVFHAMEIVLAPIMAALYMVISAALGAIKKMWDPFWDLLKTTLKTVWDLIADVIRLAWDIISGIFKVALDLLTGHWSQAWQDLKSTVSNIFGDIGKLFSDFINNALQWGKNFVQMFINGITGMIGGVENAVKGIADKVKSFLGFHSPTEDGPASDSDQWAPNFVKMFASGLAAGAPQVANAANALISPLSQAFSGAGGSGSATLGMSQEQINQINTYGQAIIKAKEEWATASQNNDQTMMASANNMANEYRQKLQQMGIDTTQFGADKTIPQTMHALQMTIQQATQAAQTQYQASTTSMMTDNTTFSTNTTLNTNTMAQQWSTMATNISDTAKHLQQMLNDVFKSITDSMQQASKQMANSVTSAFQAIADGAERSAQQVIAAVSQMQSAMASVGMTPHAVSVAGPTLNAASGVGSSMAPVLAPAMMSPTSSIGGGYGGSPIIQNFYVSNNVTKNETELAKKVAHEIYKQTKTIGKI